MGGHELTYFRGTRNLPSLVQPLVEKLDALPAVRDEVLWNRGSSGRLQFAEDPLGGDLRIAKTLDGLRYDSDYTPSLDLTLEPGDLLVLTGKSRWQMIHRVVGEGNGGAREPGVWLLVASVTEKFDVVTK